MLKSGDMPGKAAPEDPLELAVSGDECLACGRPASRLFSWFAFIHSAEFFEGERPHWQRVIAPNNAKVTCSKAWKGAEALLRL